MSKVSELSVVPGLTAPSPSRGESLPRTRSGGWGGGESPATLADWLNAATAGLQAALDITRREARLEAQLLAAHGLGVARPWLIAHDDYGLSPRQHEDLEGLLQRRVGGEPMAYILGRRAFYDLELAVTPDVLIPRPETERLVEAALERLPPAAPSRLLDLGTGSGAIALVLARQRPQAQVTAVDRSAPALAVARANAQRLGLPRVRFVLSDWYAGIEGEVFDLIVANPPYVAGDDPHLQRGDVRFEPAGALRAGADGLAAIRVIVAGGPAHLRPGGWLLLEHGHDQAAACQALLAAAGFEAVFTLSDLAGLPRVSGGRLPGQAAA